MSELITLLQLFQDESENRYFQVPDYQRGYSWDREQRRDLLSDLEELPIHGCQHYTGTIVAARPIVNEGAYFLVDGQQRLTTLVILIARTLHRLLDFDVDPGQDIAMNTAWDLFVYSNPQLGCHLWRLTLNGEHNKLFQELLSRRRVSFPKFEPRSKSDGNLKSAVEEFDRYLEQKEVSQLQITFQNITQKLGFLFYAPENQREIGLMFEVINNRGKALSELEKVKNYLIYFANRNNLHELQKKTNHAWSEILTRLNHIGYTDNQDEQSFLHACWIVFADPRARMSYNVYEGLKEKCPPDRDPKEGMLFLQAFVEFLEDAAVTMERLFELKEERTQEPESPYLERIAHHPALASILPLVLALFQREPIPKRRAETLDLVEKLNFRYFVTGIAPRSDSKQSELFRMAYCYYYATLNEDSNDTDNTVELNRQLVEFVRSYAGTRNFVKHLILEEDESWDFYHWQGLKLFLASYEQYLCAKHKQSKPLTQLLRRRDPEAHNDFLQREHILAVGDDTIYDEVEDDFLKRRLGNFVLVSEGTNKSTGPMSVEDKIYSGYQKQNIIELYQLKELQEFYETGKSFVEDECRRVRRTWRYWQELLQKMFDLRETCLANFALERWGVSQLTTEPAEVNVDNFTASGEVFEVKKQQEAEV